MRNAIPELWQFSADILNRVQANGKPGYVCLNSALHRGSTCVAYTGAWLALYKDMLERQSRDMDAFRREEGMLIPDDIDYARYCTLALPVFSSAVFFFWPCHDSPPSA